MIIFITYESGHRHKLEGVLSGIITPYITRSPAEVYQIPSGEISPRERQIEP